MTPNDAGKKAAGPKKVLIVDDDESLHNLLTPILKRAGLGVLNAKDGKEALALLELSDPLPNLILLDLGMPVMDGHHFRAAQKSKPHLKGIPVVVITSRATIETDMKNIDAKAFLKKPIEARLLLQTVASHLS
ncbi:MAG TPA: response regulator [Bdellovibrionota bacterium]|jgi:CheY-like chemotaxis protein|nr:response regulator [Bdellovibrionota bacterium]